MKKQILFLTMLTLALIFTTSIKSFGQNPNPEEDYLLGGTIFCPVANTLICADGDGLSPVPGVAYTYEISVSSPGTIHWLVTDEANVMTGPGTLTNIFDIGDGTGDYLLDSDPATYNNPANTSATISLTWKSFNGNLNNVLLVAYAVNAAGCTDNIEVYRIIPQYSFTLDLAAIFDDGTQGATECVGAVQTATYDGTNLNVVYGDNYVFFVVNAANWQTSWMPALSAASSNANSSIGSVEWAYPTAATTGGAWNATTVEVLASQYPTNDNGFIDQTGACIVVRVLVQHGVATESISDETITLSANGEMINPQTLAYDGAYPDLDEGANTGDPCVNDYTDTFDYIISARPTITATAPTPFETKVPTGN